MQLGRAVTDATIAYQLESHVVAGLVKSTQDVERVARVVRLDRARHVAKVHLVAEMRRPACA